MNDNLITLKLSYAEIKFEKYVIDDFLWVKFEKEKQLVVQKLNQFFDKVKSSQLAIKIKSELQVSLGTLAKSLVEYLKSMDIYEYSEDTIINKINYSRYDDLERYLKERAVVSTVNTVAAMTSFGVGGKSVEKQIDSKFKERFLRVFDEMCLEIYDTVAQILNLHSYECQLGKEILSRKERALNLIDSSLDMDKEKELELVSKSLELYLQGNPEGFVRLLSYLPTSENIVEDLTHLNQFTKEFTSELITAETKGVNEVYEKIVNLFLLSGLTCKEKENQLKMLDTLYYWNEENHDNLKQKLDLTYKELIQKVIEKPEQELSTQAKRQMVLEHDDLFYWNIQRQRSLKEEIYLEYKLHGSSEKLEQYASILNFNDIEVADIHFKLFARNAYSQYKKGYFGSRFEDEAAIYNKELLYEVEKTFDVAKNNNEQLLFYHDDSLLKDGDKGFVITNFRFTSQNSENSFPLNDILKIIVVDDELLLQTKNGDYVFACFGIKRVNELAVFLLDLLLQFPANQQDAEHIQQLIQNKQILLDAIAEEQNQEHNMLDTVQTNIKKNVKGLMKKFLK